MKLVSVIIPAYNHENYIKYTIESIINQSYANIELLIINDGSTDNTHKIINKLNLLVMPNKIKVLVSGGNGRFGKVLKIYGKKYHYIFPDKKKLNILDEKSIKSCLKKYKPKYFLHLAGLSRPMQEHYKNIRKS